MGSSPHWLRSEPGYLGEFPGKFESLPLQKHICFVSRHIGKLLATHAHMHLGISIENPFGTIRKVDLIHL